MSISRIAITYIAVLLVGSIAFAGGKHSQTAAPSVPPVDELVILDPKVDPEGKPVPIQVLCPDGSSRIEIPPTVLVHQYYYTGNRDFQAPMIKGGPVLVVARHPVSGEQVYIELQLPPGAPRIFYRSDRITYQYRDDSIVLCFGKSGWIGQLGKPAIHIQPRPELALRVKRHLDEKHQREMAWLDRAGIPEALASCRQATHDVAGHGAETVRTAGSILVTPFKAIRDYTPVGGLFGDR